MNDPWLIYMLGAHQVIVSQEAQHAFVKLCTSIASYLCYFTVLTAQSCDGMQSPVDEVDLPQPQKSLVRWCDPTLNTNTRPPRSLLID